MKKQIWIPILIVVVVVIGVLIFSSQKSAPIQPIEKEVIKIGAILPLTGDLAEYGNDQLAAFNLFIEEWNIKNDQKIQLIIEDSRSDPKEAVSAFNKLILNEPRIILATGSSMSLSIQPLANERQTPVITVAANLQVAQGYMIQNLPNTDDYVSLVVKELLNKKVTKIGLIFRNDDLGKGIRESLVKNLKEKIVGEEAVLPDETDFRTSITKIKSKNPEAIFIVHTGKKLGLLISQIRILMGNIPIYSTPEINYPEVKETAGSGFYNIKYSNLNIDYNRSDLKIFKDQYISRNNREPSLDSVLGYNAMIFLSNCLSYTKENLLKCLSEVKINGMTGPLSISNNRVDYSESMVINEIK